MCSCRVQSHLEKAGIQWDLHLFADTVNTEAADIAKIIQNTAQKVQAELVVLAHHNVVCHRYCSEPVLFIRSFSRCFVQHLMQVKQSYFGPGSVAQVCENLSLPLAIIP